MATQVLMIVTSNDKMGASGKATGFWLEEFAAPYYAFLGAGLAVTVASPNGGAAPIDAGSLAAGADNKECQRYLADATAKAAIANTVKIADLLTRLDDFVAVFYPGGHGPMWDLTTNVDSHKIIADFVGKGKPLGTVCHGPSVLTQVRLPSGASVIDGVKVTGFSNSEESAVGLTDVVPFSLENALKSAGGGYSAGPDWGENVVSDKNIVTGQNPASSSKAAQEVLKLIMKT